jgi:hypothetical protein
MGWKDKGEAKMRRGRACRQDEVFFGNEVALNVALDERTRLFDDGAVGEALSKMEVLPGTSERF